MNSHALYQNCQRYIYIQPVQSIIDGRGGRRKGIGSRGPYYSCLNRAVTKQSLPCQHKETAEGPYYITAFVTVGIAYSEAHLNFISRVGNLPNTHLV